MVPAEASDKRRQGLVQGTVQMVSYSTAAQAKLQVASAACHVLVLHDSIA